ncbi:MAG: RIP metalloprotease RseP [Deltaproteobacteria bacterium CG_4_8_14_3_um_filter_45_9]|nr:MAG: RIP metalloprotease RseP [Deltaproteobacteria bacterium CG03_land_8_20_14_0_80_45_14]PIX25261.1 MAG: RIP metalloprotease RseP [Deltaproteobacteria bacterium CG_4_8_14_3_um_filter_45_9]
MLLTIVSTAIVLGILIFVHELGHFIISKKMGVKVLKFSLGFGPKLIGKKIGETEYQIAVFPLGGFVKPLGEDPNEEVKEEERHRSFWAQPIWKRALIIGAGPFFNFFLAAALFSSINLFGIPYYPSKIGEVSPGLPAEQAGLKKGDVVFSIDGEEITKWDDLSQVIRNSKGKDLLLKVKRDGETLDIKVTPKPSTQKNLFGEEVPVFIVGITPFDEIVVQKVGPFRAIGKGLSQTWFGIKLTVVSIIKLIERVIPAKTIGGPILIAQMAGEQAKRGLLSLALFMAILSINLGVINLFPIPILDGGHFLFLGLEAILRKPLSIKKMEIAQQIGLIFIILLMLFAFYNDLIRIFSPGGFKF